MWDDFMQAAQAASGARAPFDQRYPLVALVESLGHDHALEREQMERALGSALEEGIVDDVIVAQSGDDARGLWACREAVGELLSRLKPYAAFDVGVPAAATEAFVDEMRAELTARYPDSQHLFFGHLGDGNLHLLSGPHPTAEQLHAVESLVYERVAAVRGCISGEHGIGTVKQPFLHLSRTPEEIALMHSLKALMDPAGILNPGRILPAGRG